MKGYRICLLCSVLNDNVPVYIKLKEWEKHLKKCEPKFKKIRGIK